MTHNDPTGGHGHAVTVLGSVPGEQLGVTLPHEHLFIDGSNWYLDDAREPELGPQPNLADRARLLARQNCHLANLVRQDPHQASREVKWFLAAGGATIVDCTPMGIGRNLRGLREVAAATGVQLIGACGWYIHSDHPEWLHDRSVEQLADHLIAEIVEGGTDGIRCGFIGELGIEGAVPLDCELRVIQAGARAQAATGAPVSIHVPSGILPAARPETEKLVTVFEQAGGDPSRLILCHQDGTGDDLAHQERLLRAGVNLEFDSFGFHGSARFEQGGRYVQFPTDTQRITELARLVERGWVKQLLISQDVTFNTGMRSWGGWGLTHILESLPDRFDEAGLDEDVRRVLMVDNPRRLLAFESSPQGT